MSAPRDGDVPLVERVDEEGLGDRFLVVCFGPTEVIVIVLGYRDLKVRPDLRASLKEDCEAVALEAIVLGGCENFWRSPMMVLLPVEKALEQPVEYSRRLTEKFVHHLILRALLCVRDSLLPGDESDTTPDGMIDASYDRSMIDDEDDAERAGELKVILSHESGLEAIAAGQFL